MTTARLDLTRSQVLAYRRRVGSLDERLPRNRRSLEKAAWAGLQDSMPRAALLSIHARVEDTTPDTWDDPAFVQLWGPRYSTYVVAERDIAVFTLGRLSDDAADRQLARTVAAELRDVLAGSTMTDRDAGHALGRNPNRFRYGAPTGTILIRWPGAGAPTVWTVAAPDTDPHDARLELTRRYLHVLGPSTPRSFARWAGLPPQSGVAAFDDLKRTLIPVRTPIGEAWILSGDESEFRTAPAPAFSARFLPSGDAYWLLQGDDRELLVEDATHRDELWPSRVWPGALLVGGEIVGTWRRSQNKLAIDTWRRLTRDEKASVDAEGSTLPIPGIKGAMSISYTYDHQGQPG
ncbi:MAG: DNA glycosylase AlkZ-like family protein [Acidimicrobiia bacterium]